MIGALAFILLSSVLHTGDAGPSGSITRRCGEICEMRSDLAVRLPRAKAKLSVNPMKAYRPYFTCSLSVIQKAPLSTLNQHEEMDELLQDALQTCRQKRGAGDAVVLAAMRSSSHPENEEHAKVATRLARGSSFIVLTANYYQQHAKEDAFANYLMGAVPELAAVLAKVGER